MKVTKNKIYFTIKFKEGFWIGYQAGNSPRKIIEDLGYDLKLFRQKQIDSLVQRIKGQALSGGGFREGENRTQRMKIKESALELGGEQGIEQMKHELLYLRQEMEFIKKIIKADNAKRKN